MDPARRHALLALLVVQVLFGTLGVVGKFAIPHLGADGVAAWRIAGGAVVFGVLRRVLGLPGVPWSSQARLALCAAIGIAGNQLLFLHGLARTTAVHATLLVTLTPVFTLLLGAALGHERLSWRPVVGVALAVAGVAVLLSHGLHGGSVVGDLLIVANTALYSFYLVLSRPLLATHPPLSVVAGVFAWGVPLTLPFTGLPPVEGPPVAWAAMAWILAGPTVGTYLLNLVALQHVPATVVGVFIALQPFVAAALAVPLLDESIGWRQALAASASVAGILLVSRRPASPPVGGRT